MHPVAVSALSAGTLLAGWAVADGTGVRALGGLVLLVGATACAVLWHRAVGTPRTAGLLGVFALSFVGAHVLAPVLGGWPAVLVVAAGMGIVSLSVLIRGLRADTSPAGGSS